MISLLLFFLTTVLSSLAERIGAIALEITGLPEEQAEFQAISAFSGVGYTTKEAEYILAHPERRKIIKWLISFGSAGIITMAATLVGTLLSSRSIVQSVSASPGRRWLPLNLTQLVLLLAVAFFYLLYRLTRDPAVSRLLKEIIAAMLLKGRIVRRVSFEEVLVNASGSGVFQIEITANNPLLGKSVREADLREHDITVLYVNRLSESTDYPPDSFRFQEGDIIAVFGPLTAINDRCCDVRGPEARGRTSPADEPLPVPSPAPAFRLKDQSGREVALEDTLGKKNLVLVFYPKDKSFFCTSQLKSFSDALGRLRELDTEVLAVNQESQVSHAGFCDTSQLRIPLLSDPAKETCAAYRALMLGGLLVNRTVYAIDKEGIIRYARRGNPPLGEVLAALREIQAPGPRPAAVKEGA